MIITANDSSQHQRDQVAAKYAYLLQPIRDMVKNWDVDIANHLDDFLEEVCVQWW